MIPGLDEDIQCHAMIMLFFSMLANMTGSNITFQTESGQSALWRRITLLIILRGLCGYEQVNTLTFFVTPKGME